VTEAMLALTWIWAVDGWIVATAAVCAMACALLGNFLVLRGMSMMGDAISHAVLPGIAIAFLVSGSMAPGPMFTGAVIVGALTALLVQWLHRFGQVEEGAAMGVVFTALFAVGLILIRQAADHVHIDADCVLYGNLEFVPLVSVETFSGRMPSAFLTLLGVLGLDVLFVGLFYKELKVTSFDPQMATSLGIGAGRLHYMLMTMVAVTTVAAFEAVGSILVIAMLIVPPSIAYLLTMRLASMIGMSLLMAALSAVLGHGLAITAPRLLDFEDTHTAGMMAVAAGGLLVGTIALGPRHGLVSRWRHRRALARRILGEDLLGLLYRLEESGEEAADAERCRQVLGLGPRRFRRLVSDRVHAAEVAWSGGRLALGEAGRARARELVRSHRLWESYLADATTLAEDHLHLPAAELEHLTGEQIRRNLETIRPAGRRDPHGRDIPE